MQARSLIVEDIKNLKEKIVELKDTFNPSVGIFFNSITHDVMTLHTTLKESGIEFLGATTAGEIALKSGEEGIAYEEAISGMLFDIQRDAFDIKSFEIRENGSFSAGVEAGKWGKSVFNNPAFIVLAGGLGTDGEAIVNGMVEGTGSDTMPLYGGLAGDDGGFKETFTYSTEKVSGSGLMVMVVDGDKIEMQGLASSGWVASGAIKKVTKSAGNIVYSIDNTPALDFYLERLDISEDEMPAAGFEYPLLILNDDGSSVIRAVIDVNKEDRSLVFAGTVGEKKVIQFSTSNGDEASENTIAHINEFEWLDKEPDAMLLFSCVARHIALGPTVEDEIEVIGERWDVPLAGYFTYGEIGMNSAGKCDFHNETCRSEELV